MSALRVHVSMGLLLLMCTLTGHCGESAPPTAPVAAHGGADAHHQHQHQQHQQQQQQQQQQQHPQDERRIVELVRHVEENRFRHGVKTDAPSTPDLRNVSRDRADKTMVVFPTDPKKKEKFLKHITGPLYFSPKCRKHVYRLYHHTRDCTIPAYFKRCARLLTRLAGSPQCTEG